MPVKIPKNKSAISANIPPPIEMSRWLELILKEIYLTLIAGKSLPFTSWVVI